MATFYLDFENGNDANDGTTFANRWKTTTSGATAARTAPGDIIRIMGSPAPTSLGQNGVWISEALQSAKTITTSTNTTPVVINCTAHGYITGDTVSIESHTGNTGNGTWEITRIDANTFSLVGSVGIGAGGGGSVRLRNNTRIMLATPVTQNIASTGPRTTAWTAAANVTTALSLIAKEHNQSDEINILSSFTTGLAAYFPTGTLNLSAYQQVSFWIRQTVGTIGAAGAISLRLCSDALGVTAVNTINIPSLAGLSQWRPITVDLATNLGSSIRSIAFYVNTDNGAQSFNLANIIACKASSAADSLTLTSLIGKNTVGETFWGIQSINGTRVMLDQHTNQSSWQSPGAIGNRGYYGTTETVTTWKRETIKLGPANFSTAAVQTIQEGGDETSGPITYSGGWDRTAMSSQNLETWLDGQNGHGYGINAASISWIAINNVAGVRFNAFINNANQAAVAMNHSIIAANNNSGGGAISISTAGRLSVQAMCANQLAFNTNTNGAQVVNLGNLYSNESTGSFRASASSSLQLKSYNNGGHGIATQAANVAGGKVVNSQMGANPSGSLVVSPAAAILYCSNCLFEDATEVALLQTAPDSYVYSHKHDQTANNHKVFASGMLISSATDQRRTASGISWKIQPTDATLWHSLRPVVFSLAKVACSANNLVTIKAWMRRDNAGLTMRLVCRGGQIAGVASDVIASVTTTDAWEEETITFTPTEVGVVEIIAEAWGGTTFSGWVDDMTISQA
jgi:hypothetical protein